MVARAGRDRGRRTGPGIAAGARQRRRSTANHRREARAKGRGRSQISQADASLRTASPSAARPAGARLNASSARPMSSARGPPSGKPRRASPGGDRPAAGGRTRKRLEFLYAHGGIPRTDRKAPRHRNGSRRTSAIGQAALDQARPRRAGRGRGTLRGQVSQADLEAARAGVRQAEAGVKSA